MVTGAQATTARDDKLIRAVQPVFPSIFRALPPEYIRNQIDPVVAFNPEHAISCR